MHDKMDDKKEGFCHVSIKAKRKPLKLFIVNNSRGFLSTQTRGRTGMEVNPLVFETSASTDSAIWAY